MSLPLEVVEEMARFMMMEILYDNGCINRLEPEEKFYDFNNSYVFRMSIIIMSIFLSNPGFEFTQERLELMAMGGMEDIDGEEVYSNDHELLRYKGILELRNLLNDHFNKIPD